MPIKPQKPSNEQKYGINFVTIFAAILIFIGIANIMYLTIYTIKPTTQITILYGIASVWVISCFVMANRTKKEPWKILLGCGLAAYYVVTTYAFYRTILLPLTWLSIMCILSVCIFTIGIRVRHYLFDFLSFLGLSFAGIITIHEIPELAAFVLPVHFLLYILLSQFKLNDKTRMVAFPVELLFCFIFSLQNHKTESEQLFLIEIASILVGIGLFYAYEMAYKDSHPDNQVQKTAHIVIYGLLIITEISLLNMTLHPDITYLGTLTACVLCFTHLTLQKNQTMPKSGTAFLQVILIYIAWANLFEIIEDIFQWENAYQYSALQAALLSIILLTFAVVTKGHTAFCCALAHFFMVVIEFQMDYSSQSAYDHPISFFGPLLIITGLIFAFHFFLKKSFYTSRRKIMLYLFSGYAIAEIVNELFYFIYCLWSGTFLEGIAADRLRVFAAEMNLSWMDDAFTYAFLACFLCIVAVTNYCTDWEKNQVLVLNQKMEEKDDLLNLNRVISSLVMLGALGTLVGSGHVFMAWRLVLSVAVLLLLIPSVMRGKRNGVTWILDLAKVSCAVGGIAVGWSSEASMRWVPSIAMIILAVVYIWYGLLPQEDETWIKRKKPIRVFGLVLISAAFAKLILWDFRAYNGYMQAVGYILGGACCLWIAHRYHSLRE